MAEGGVERKDGVGLFSGNADRFIEMLLFPIVRQLSGEIYFFREFVEDRERQWFCEVVACPFVIIVFEKPAGVRACYQVVMTEAAIDDLLIDGIDEFFRAGDVGAARCFL